MAKGRKIKINDSIELSEDNHQRLRDHLWNLIESNEEVRNAMVVGFAEIDLQLHGIKNLSKDDEKRDKRNKSGEPPTPTAMNPQFGISQIEDAVTDIMKMIYPDVGMFQAVSTADLMEVAGVISNKLNGSLSVNAAYVEFAKAVLDMVKYNFGGFMPEWKYKVVPQYDVDSNGNPYRVGNKGVDIGLKVTATDPYNVIWDTTFPINRVAEEGEFWGMVEPLSAYEVERKTRNGEYFLDESPSTYLKRFTGVSVINLYRNRPALFDDASTERLTTLLENGRKSTDFTNFFKKPTSQFDGCDTQSAKVTMYVRLIPKQYGLSDVDDYEIWKFVMITESDSVKLVRGEVYPMNHGLLNWCACGSVPNTAGANAPSYGNRLIAIQQFIAFQMNHQIEAQRKSLVGTILYDSSAINGGSISSTYGRYPVTLSQGQSISDIFYEVRHSQQTIDAINNIRGAMEWMQNILPTEQISRIMDLQRATEFQAVTAAQSANRRIQLIARLILSQAFSTFKQMAIQTIYQNWDGLSLQGPDGDTVQLPTNEGTLKKIESDINIGINMADKYPAINALQEMLRTMLQSGQLQSEVDMKRVVDLILRLYGEDFSAESFTFKSPVDQLPVEERNMAYQVYQQAKAQAEASQAEAEGNRVRQGAQQARAAGGALPNL